MINSTDVQENFAATMRELSAKWRNMSQQQKDVYSAAAARSQKPLWEGHHFNFIRGMHDYSELQYII